MSRLLIDEPPLQFLPSLARRVGLVEALILQQCHYLAVRNERDGREDFHQAGHWWVKCSITEWHEILGGCVSVDTIRRGLADLIEGGHMIAERFGDARDRTRWLRVDESTLVAKPRVQGGNLPCSEGGNLPQCSSIPEGLEVSHSARTREDGSGWAVAMYRDAFPGVNLTPYQLDLIGQKVTDAEAWRLTLDYWRGSDYRPASIPKLLACYAELCDELRAGTTTGDSGRRDGGDVVVHVSGHALPAGVPGRANARLPQRVPGHYGHARRSEGRAAPPRPGGVKRSGELSIAEFLARNGYLDGRVDGPPGIA